VSYSHRAKQMCPILTGLNKFVVFSQGLTNVSYSHRAKQMCPILTRTIKCVLFSLFCRRVSYLGRSCPVELLRLGKRFLTSIVHFNQMSYVSYSTSYLFKCVLSVKIAQAAPRPCCRCVLPGYLVSNRLHLIASGLKRLHLIASLLRLKLGSGVGWRCAK
jgi:hypothetical protein